jgi:hypothetical protein
MLENPLKYLAYGGRGDNHIISIIALYILKVL